MWTGSTDMGVRACVTQSIIIIIGVVRLVSIPNPNFDDDQSERGILSAVSSRVALYQKGWRTAVALHPATTSEQPIHYRFDWIFPWKSSLYGSPIRFVVGRVRVWTEDPHESHNNCCTVYTPVNTRRLHWRGTIMSWLDYFNKNRNFIKIIHVSNTNPVFLQITFCIWWYIWVILCRKAYFW